jgi:hypothetical protein
VHSRCGLTARIRALLQGTMSAAIVLCSLFLAVKVRPFWKGLLAAVSPVVVVAMWWTSIAPSNVRDWTPDVARMARATFDGSSVTIQNVRNFEYRSESAYDPRWETRTYNLERIRGVDLFLSFWGPSQIAHTIASWKFDDGRYLAISIETRKEKGESYSALRGFFRQYEIYYVVGDERDLIELRTRYRGEQVFLYHLSVPAAQARALLIDYLEEINRLADHPRWYNALTQNCTTTIRGHAQNAGVGGRLDRGYWQTATSINSCTNAGRSIPNCRLGIFKHSATSPKEQRLQTTPRIFLRESAKGCPN